MSRWVTRTFINFMKLWLWQIKKYVSIWATQLWKRCQEVVVNSARFVFTVDSTWMRSPMRRGWNPNSSWVHVMTDQSPWQLSWLHLLMDVKLERCHVEDNSVFLSELRSGETFHTHSTTEMSVTGVISGAQSLKSVWLTEFMEIKCLRRRPDILGINVR